MQKQSGRSFSLRGSSGGLGGSKKSLMASLRGVAISDMSKETYKLVKQDNQLVSAYESAAREGQALATSLSAWGNQTKDDAIDDVSDRLGVLINEVAETEESFASQIDETRTLLKQIRNTEASIDPALQKKKKILDELNKVKYYEPESPKVQSLEQALVRAEAENLVAEAQLTNVMRQNFKEAYQMRFAAVIQRAEKQLIIADAAMQVLDLLDDSPIVPGEQKEPFGKSDTAKHILIECENRLKNWSEEHNAILASSGGSTLNNNLLPKEDEGEEVETTEPEPHETAATAS